MSNVIEAPDGVSPAEYMQAVAAATAQAPTNVRPRKKPGRKPKARPAAEAENAVSVRLVGVEPERLAQQAKPAPAAEASGALKKYRYDREFIPDMANGPFPPFLEALNRRGAEGWRIYEKVPGRKKVPVPDQADGGVSVQADGRVSVVDAAGYTVVWEMEVVA